jgi:hypothetical protein
MEKKFIGLVRVVAAAIVLAGVAQFIAKKIVIGVLVALLGVLTWIFARKIVEHLGMDGD